MHPNTSEIKKKKGRESHQMSECWCCDSSNYSEGLKSSKLQYSEGDRHVCFKYVVKIKLINEGINKILQEVLYASYVFLKGGG